MLALTGTLVFGTFAAFTATTTNSGNSIDSGTVKIDDDSGATSALYVRTNQKPGDSYSACLRIKYNGSLGAAVKLYTSAGITNGSTYNLQVERGSGLTTVDGTRSCAGFTWASSAYNGALGSFAHHLRRGRGRQGRRCRMGPERHRGLPVHDLPERRHHAERAHDRTVEWRPAASRGRHAATKPLRETRTKVGAAHICGRPRPCTRVTAHDLLRQGPHPLHRLVTGCGLAVAMFLSGPVAGGEGKPTARVAVTAAAGSEGLALSPTGSIVAASLSPGRGFAAASGRLRISNPDARAAGVRLTARIDGRQLDEAVQLRIRSGRTLFSGSLVALRRVNIRPLVIGSGRGATVEVAARLRRGAIGWQHRATRIALVAERGAAP